MMDWAPILALILGNGALILPLFLWNRAESRDDMRHIDAKLESNRELVRAIHEESKALIDSIKEESRNFQIAMMQESKDFHGRLCAIEERNKEAKGWTRQ